MRVPMTDKRLWDLKMDAEGGGIEAPDLCLREACEEIERLRDRERELLDECVRLREVVSVLSDYIEEITAASLTEIPTAIKDAMDALDVLKGRDT